MIPSTNFRNNDFNKTNQNRANRQQISLKEGVLVNNFIKNGYNCSSNDLESYILIPESVSMPSDLNSNKEKIGKNSFGNPVIPLAIAPIAVLGIGAALSGLYKRSYIAKINKTLMDELPDLGRNINITDENILNTVLLFSNPSWKALSTTLTIITASVATFIMKNFIDGFKEIWVKKQSADIKRDLEESLIEVETRSFSGKNQILKNLLSETSGILKDELRENTNSIKFKGANEKLFSNFMNNKTSFKNNHQEESRNSKNLLYSMMGAGTVLISGLLIGLIFKNIRAVTRKFEEAKPVAENAINKHVDRLEGSVKETLKEKIFEVMPKSNGGNAGRIGLNSYVANPLAFLYAYLVCPTPQTGGLLLAVSGLTGFGYVGTKSVEAVKEVQVNKVNAQTELKLQDRLVKVELMNFLAKKNSVINPLVQEFKRYAAENPDDKETLKRMYNNILEEIKNGPPFVYS